MGTLLAGAARVLLKPPVGVAMAGYGARAGRSTGVHDELAAQALVLSDGATKAAIVGVDVLALGSRVADEICELASRKTGIRPDGMIIAATHTHSGPLYNIWTTPRDSTDRGPDRDVEWERALPGKIADAIAVADQRLEPAVLKVGAGRFTLGTNRRLVTAYGEVHLAPNYRGVADHELTALGVYRQNGTPISFVLNYPCHGVVLCEDNLLFSRDFPGFAQDILEQDILEEDHLEASAAPIPVAIFLNGATGNIDPRFRGSFETAAQAGRQMADAALTGLAPSKPIADGDLKSRRVELRLRLKDLEAQLAAARACVEQTALSLAEHRGGEHRLRRLRSENQQALDALKALEAMDQDNHRDRRVDHDRREIITKLTILTLGDIALVGIPGEAFVEFGLALKANSGFRHTFVVGYCNDLVGYIPTQEAYAWGGYEVRSARVAQGAGEEMLAAALRALRGLRQD